MNVDTGQMGTLADVLRDAQPGERVIPATIIPNPYERELRQAMQHGAYERTRSRLSKAERELERSAARARTPVMYGPRKPLREVRAELLAAKATE
jgi:hypothetical protein